MKIKQRGTKFWSKNKQRLSNDLKISKIVKGLLIYGIAYKTEKVYLIFNAQVGSSATVRTLIFKLC